MAGLALAVMPTLAKTFRLYAALLNVDSLTADQDFKILRLRILTERARFESWIQQVSKLDPSQALPIQSLMFQVVDLFTEEFSKARKTIESLGLDLDPQPPQESKKPSVAQRLKLELIGIEKLQQTVKRLRELNDALWNLLGQLERESAQAYRPPSVVANDETGVSDISMGRDPRPEEAGEAQVTSSGKTDAKASERVFRELVSVSENALRSISSSSKELMNIYLSYRLWSHAWETNDLYALVIKLPRDIDETKDPDLLKMHFRALAHLIWTLSKLSRSS